MYEHRLQKVGLINVVGTCYYNNDMVVLMTDIDFLKGFGDDGKKKFMEVQDRVRKLFVDNKDVIKSCIMVRDDNGSVYHDGKKYVKMGDEMFYTMMKSMFDYENSLFVWLRRFVNWFYGNNDLYRYTENERVYVLHIILGRLYYLMNNCYLSVDYGSGVLYFDDKSKFFSMNNHGLLGVRCFIINMLVHGDLRKKWKCLICDYKESNKMLYDLDDGTGLSDAVLEKNKNAKKMYNYFLSRLARGRYMKDEEENGVYEYGDDIGFLQKKSGYSMNSLYLLLSSLVMETSDVVLERKNNGVDVGYVTRTDFMKRSMFMTEYDSVEVGQVFKFLNNETSEYDVSSGISYVRQIRFRTDNFVDDMIGKIKNYENENHSSDSFVIMAENCVDTVSAGFVNYNLHDNNFCKMMITMLFVSVVMLYYCEDKRDNMDVKKYLEDMFCYLCFDHVDVDNKYFDENTHSSAYFYEIVNYKVVEMSGIHNFSIDNTFHIRTTENSSNVFKNINKKFNGWQYGSKVYNKLGVKLGEGVVNDRKMFVEVCCNYVCDVYKKNLKLFINNVIILWNKRVDVNRASIFLLQNIKKMHDDINNFYGIDMRNVIKNKKDNVMICEHIGDMVRSDNKSNKMYAIDKMRRFVDDMLRVDKKNDEIRMKDVFGYDKMMGIVSRVLLDFEVFGTTNNRLLYQDCFIGCEMYNTYSKHWNDIDRLRVVEFVNDMNEEVRYVLKCISVGYSDNYSEMTGHAYCLTFENGKAIVNNYSIYEYDSGHIMVNMYEKYFVNVYPYYGQIVRKNNIQYVEEIFIFNKE